MGTETTSATYRRTQNPLVTKFFYGITGIQINRPKTVVPPFLHLFGDVFILFLFHHSSASLPPPPSHQPPLPQKAKNKKKSPEKLYLQRKYPAFWGILFIFQLTATESTIFARPNLLVPCLYFHLRFLSGARLSPSPLPHD